jgi:hypothetical protein
LSAEPTAVVPAKLKPGPGAARLLLLLLVYSLGASFALSEFIRYPGFGNVTPTLGGERFFGDVIYGRAPRPYVERVLVPWAVRLAVAATPPRLRAAGEAHVRRWFTVQGRPAWIYASAFEFLVVRTLLFACLVGFAFSLRRLARLTLALSGLELDVVPVAAFLVLPGMYGYGSMLYDLPALLLFTLGLVLIAGRRFSLYLVVFFLAVLNKETAILLSFVWGMDALRRRRPGRVAGGLAVQVVMWAAVRGLVVWLHRGNPGEELALHLFRNIDVMRAVRNYFLFRPVNAWLAAPTGLNVLYLAALVWGLFALRRAPRFLRDAFWIAPFLFVLAMFFGNVDEMRVYYELFPVLFLVLIRSAYALLGYGRAPPGVAAGTPGDRTAGQRPG